MSKLTLILAASLASTAAQAADIECSLSLEDRSRPPWTAEVTAPTEDAARAKALAAACDALAPEDKQACHKGAAGSAAWDVSQRGGQWRAELVVTRPNAVIKAGARAKSSELACKAALAAACKLVGHEPLTTAFATPACKDTQWFCYGTGNSLLETKSPYASFH